MSIILFKGKYVKPLIELLGEKGEYIFLLRYMNGTNDLQFRKIMPLLMNNDYKQIVITKKDYKRLIVLLSIMDNPLEAFESIYCV